ncbi:MAG: hypothetical protein ACK8QZ_09975 [Anaerolineales bacterium]
MARKWHIFIILVLLAVPSCSIFGAKRDFPKVESAFVSSVTLGPIDKFALSPDGSKVIDEAFTETELSTGKQTQRFIDTDGLEIYGSTGGLMGWSVDGRYLAATQMVLAPDSTILNTPVVIIDTKTNTARYYKGSFNGWSAVNSERFLTNNWTPTNVSDGSEITVPWGTIDFRNVEVRGNENFLWSVKENLPIAYFTWQPLARADGMEIGQHVNKIVSYDKGETIQVEIYTEKPLQRTISFIFDPTGQYALLTLWERSEIPPEGNDEIFGKFVVDTVLIVVDWRRGEYRELFRLSSLEDGKVVALPAKTAWSADGSTIFVARKDAPAVVLKVKYP